MGSSVCGRAMKRWRTSKRREQMKRPIDPEVSGLISEIERHLRLLKARLIDEAQEAVPNETALPPSAFGRTSCANLPIRSSSIPPAPVVHPTLGSL